MQGQAETRLARLGSVEKQWALLCACPHLLVSHMGQPGREPLGAIYEAIIGQGEEVGCWEGRAGVLITR